jgi:hypothetical protein
MTGETQSTGWYLCEKSPFGKLDTRQPEGIFYDYQWAEIS